MLPEFPANGDIRLQFRINNLLDHLELEMPAELSGVCLAPIFRGVLEQSGIQPDHPVTGKSPVAFFSSTTSVVPPAHNQIALAEGFFQLGVEC